MKIPVIKNIIFNAESGEFEALPEVIDFSIDKKILSDESPAIVKWEVLNASEVFLNEMIVESKGQKSFEVKDLLIIRLRAKNSAGDVEPESLLLDIDRTPPKIHFFSMDIESTTPDSPIRLSWNIEGARKVEIDNGIGDVTGMDFKNTTLHNNGIFNITASNYFGFTTKRRADIRDFPVSTNEAVIIEEPKFTFSTASIVQPDFTLKNISFEPPGFNDGKIAIDPLEFKVESKDDMVIGTPEITESKPTTEINSQLNDPSNWSRIWQFLTKISKNIWNRK